MGRPRREGIGLDDALKQEPGIRIQDSGALSGKQLEVKASALEFCSPILWQTRPLLNSLTSDFSANRGDRRAQVALSIFKRARSQVVPDILAMARSGRAQVCMEFFTRGGPWVAPGYRLLAPDC
jgi:hypothetical protein